HGLIEVMVRVAGPQKIKRGVNDAQSIAGILEDTMYERPKPAGIGALKRPVVLSDVKRGRMSRGVYRYIINAVVDLVQLCPSDAAVSRAPQSAIVCAAVGEVHGRSVRVDRDGPDERTFKLVLAQGAAPGCPSIK